MKKRFLPVILILTAWLIVFMVPSAFALNLQVKKLSSDEVLIADLNKPAKFELEITNFDQPEYIEFYNLLGFQMFPVGTIKINGGETKKITLSVSPLGELKQRGHYSFDYFIRGSDGAQQKEKLSFEIIELDEAFEVGSGEIDPESRSIQIYIHNKKNFDFGNMTATFKSAFFSFEKKFSLGPYERENFEVQLNKEDFRNLMAGYYTLNVDVNVDGKTTEVEGIIKFVEKDIITTTSNNYGFIINTNVIKKTNEGNVIAKSETVIKKNIISRLFTTLTPEPTSVDRQGLIVYYTWTKDLSPGETLEINARTNWLFPLLVVLLIVAIVLLIKQYSKTAVVLRKRVSFVRARGGEFALKVTVFVYGKKHAERINVIDRLPPLVTLYEKFGGEKPTRVDEKNRRIEWNFEKLESGEKRVLSYIIYSKVGVLGKFALPTATAIYEKDGEIKETESNRAFFIAEQRKIDE